MNWTDFYLICFFVGFALTVISVLMGVLDIHLPGTDAGGHVSGDGATFDAGADVATAGHHQVGAHAPQVSPFNFATAMAFLAWFGGTGYLLTRYTAFWSVLALGIASVVGVAGAGLVFLFMVKVFVEHDHTMNPADSRLEGLLATVVSPIREGGTGEIVFTLGGARQTSGARDVGARAIGQGEEVMIERYEEGIAYVRRWAEVEEGAAAAGPEKV